MIQYGVLPCDFLKNFKVQSYPCIIVVNTDRSYQPGEHWCLFFIEHKGDAVEFYDSYGLGIRAFAREFYDFARKNARGIYCNNIQLQNESSTVCGDYCLYFAYRRLQGKTPCEIYDEFSVSDLKDNDAKVRKFASEYEFLKPFVLNGKKCLFRQQCCTEFKNTPI